MATKHAIQKTKTGRRTTGDDSEFHLWRVRHHLTQADCTNLFGVCDTTIQRWDAHEHAAPALLEPVLAYHSIMRAEIDELKDVWDRRDRMGFQEGDLKGLDFDALLQELARDARNYDLVNNMKLLGLGGQAAVLYGIEHGLWG